MNILHYTMGVPPVRGGGLVKYMLDLAQEQANTGYHVSIICPGKIKIFNKEVKIVKSNEGYENLDIYNIINSLPVPLANGILDISSYTKPCDIKVFKEFIDKMNIDIMHVHSFMGLHSEFLEAAKEQNVKIIFTSHDYFGICPKTDKMYENNICFDNEWTNCQKCSVNAFSKQRIIRDQSTIFKYYKKSKLIEQLKRNTYLFNIVQNLKTKRMIRKSNKTIIEEKSIDYIKLKLYYNNMFNMVDIMHYNSIIAKNMFEHVLGTTKKSFLIHVQHKDIKDNRHIKKFDNILKISYLNNDMLFKGYPILKDVLNEIYNQGNKNFILNVFFDKKEKSENYVHYNKHYNYRELIDIFENTDVLVMPSLWRETFGFVVLEALSYGVPVIITNNVGAKDLLDKFSGIGFITEPNAESLKSSILKIYNDRELLIEANKAICEANIRFSFEEHVNKVINIYKN